MGKEIYHVQNDERFRDPFIDVDEMRERTLDDGRVLPYRFIHGGFAEQKVKFIICIPPKEEYKGRFFHYLSPFPGPDEEMVSLGMTGEDDKIAFALLHGAYHVESNMGSEHAFGARADSTMYWKTSAAVAEFSRAFVMKLYGCGRPYGYVHGGSGGSYKAIACIENTDAWDGAVPYVIGSPYSLPNTVVMRAQAQRVLRNQFDAILASTDVGHKPEDAMAGMTEDQAKTYREVLHLGFPPRSIVLEAAGYQSMGSVPVLMPGIKMKDPTYFTDFWTKEGYAGSDPTSNANADRIHTRTKVTAVHLPGQAMTEKQAKNGVDDSYNKMLGDANNSWIEVEHTPEGNDLYLDGAEIVIESGEAAGTRLALQAIEGNCLIIGQTFGVMDMGAVLAGIKPEDEVLIDNSDIIAVEHYYRHQVPPDTTFHAWDQFRDAAGNPITPQRPVLIGPDFCGTGTIQEGTIQGKVIVCQSLDDESTCPWCADWYRDQVIKTYGNDDNIRVYYNDRCLHGDVKLLENNVITNYLPIMRQALLDISDWVERGIEPLPTTAYIRDEGFITVPAAAKERRGMQPVVTLTANGCDVAHVKAGEEVTFEALAEIPEGAGLVTAIDYAWESDLTFGTDGMSWVEHFPNLGEFRRTESEGICGAVSHTKHAYEQPGEYFASVRVKINRTGDATDPFTQVKNIGRAKIIVE